MKIISKNKRAKFDYELIDKYHAGISLLGNEVKSIKDGNVDLVGSYIYIDNKNNAQWINANIEKYKFQNESINYNPRRTRQLLLNSAEIKKIKNEIKLKKLTVIPYCIFINKRGLIKLEIYTAKGKNKQDKRESQKKDDAKKEMKRYI